MNAAASRPRTGFKFMLIVKEGPDQGTSFQLLPPQVTIGRDSENNVILNDQRVSRKAAVIELSLEKITITNLSARQPLYIDGENVTATSIKDGAVIRIGDSELIFMVEALPLSAPEPAKPHLHVVDAQTSVMPSQIQPQAVPAPAPAAGPGFAPHPSSPRPRAAAPDNGKRNFYLIVGGVVLFFVWLMTSGPGKQKAKDPTLKTVEEFQKDIEGTEKRSDEITKKHSFKTDEEKTRFEEANRHYMEGFRDYQKGQWSRALRSFETARAIDPSHELARRYYKLAEKQRDEDVARWTLEGRQYREKQMYSRCSAAFEKVLDIITNRDDLKYKQAEALKKECDLLTDDRYR